MYFISFSTSNITTATTTTTTVFDSGASEPRNMAYMTRLGLWGLGTPFAAFQDFIDAIEKRFCSASLWFCVLEIY